MLALTIACATMVCTVTAALGQQPQWTLDRAMPGDFQGQMVFDGARERVVLYGAVDYGVGSAVHPPRSFTFEWDGQVWQQRAIELGFLRGATLCYDASRQRTVRLGGSRNSAPTDEVWQWDGQVWARQFEPGPTPRTYAAATFHVATNRLLLFGGWASTTSRLGDTWERGPTGWTIRNSSLMPTPRFQHAMAYDERRQRTVLFGGQGLTQVTSDTWEWDGSAWLGRPAATIPPVRSQPAFAYDPVQARVVMFGGNGTTSRLDDTWEWDGVDWRQLTPPHHPAARGGATMVYAGAVDRLLLFGGARDFERLTDTWSFDGVDWRLLQDSQSPPMRSGPLLTHDLGSGHTLMFGGWPPDPRTWQHDGQRWRSMPTTQAPTPRYELHAACDVLRGRTVLFGGNDSTSLLGDTWEWNGTTWSPRWSWPSPTPRAGGCMAFDLGRGVCVLFGGQNRSGVFSETWEWNGSVWQQRVTAHVPQWTSFAMTYDWALGRIVMFGGSDPQGSRADTWHYDGVDWTLMGTAGPMAPPPRPRPALTYHLGRGRTVLFGGGDWNGFRDDLWEWNGASWTPWSAAVRAEAQTGAAMTYDAGNDRLLLTGGATGQALADTWQLAAGGVASTTAFGVACAVGPLPDLRSDEPFLGNRGCAVEIVRAAPTCPTLLLGGLGPAQVTLPGGCSLLVQAPLVTVLGVTNVHGSTHFPVPVPSQLALRGATIACQATVFDGIGPLAGTTWTAGVQLRVGQ